MNELIAQIAASAGIDEATAQKAIGIILSFLKQEGDQEKAGALIDALPGAKELIGSSDAGSSLSSGLGGLMGGGVMAVAGELQGIGLGMGDIQTVTKDIVGFARKHAGDELVDDVIASIPGLGQFV